MSHLYKRYTTEQLIEEETKLKQKLAQARQDQQPKLIAVNQRLIEIVQSFMLDQTNFKVGDIFTLKADESDLFIIDEMVGVIAWCYQIDPGTHEKTDPTNRIAKLLILLGEKVVQNDIID